MFYRVTGILRKESAAELHHRLNDGSIARQKPDGAEIVAALRRAVVRPDGRIQWSELCYCDPPLQHERSTVLDRYFDQIETEAIADRETYQGGSFLERLETLARPPAS